MKKLLFAVVSFLVLAGAVNAAPHKNYPYRWVYFNSDIYDAPTVAKFREMAELCEQNGINGIVLSGPIERLDLDSPYTFKTVAEFRRIAEAHNIELIPLIFNVGYNSFMLHHDKNLAEGLPVRDELFVAGATTARHVSEFGDQWPDGSFESATGSDFPGFTFPYPERKIAFADKQVAKLGTTSLRFEKFGENRDEAMVRRKITVKPHHIYRVSFWVKTEDLDPSNPFGSGRFRIEALGGGERRLNFFDPQVPGNTDWRMVYAGFNSKDYTEVELSVGVYGGKTGRFWIDGLKVEEAGMVNILRRPGCPLVVRDEASGVVYEEGLDFARVEDIQLNFMFDHEGPELELLPGGRIEEGTRLRVSWYQGTAIYQGQTPICMSEPKVYEIWKKQAELYQRVFGTDKYFLNTDELRVAASCKACQDRGLSAPRILGETVNWQVKTIREVNPRAELFIWSDMFDPNHNADEREYYYLVDEDWHEAWKYIPRDLTMVCWHGRRAAESLAHFDSLGYKTLAGAYYDADDLDNVKNWLNALDEASGSVGIMYTTWLNKYELLGPFGKLVSGWGK